VLLYHLRRGSTKCPKAPNQTEKNISFSFSFYVVSKLPKRNKKKRERKKQKIIHKALPHRGSIT
jgi:hypothetical protein